MKNTKAKTERPVSSTILQKVFPRINPLKKKLSPINLSANFGNESRISLLQEAVGRSKELRTDLPQPINLTTPKAISIKAFPALNLKLE